MNKGLNLPFRRYEIGKVFRDGPVKVGRNREFYQCDVDVCGITGQYVEAELFAMAFTCYNALGINSYIEWNNRKFLSGIILEIVVILIFPSSSENLTDSSGVGIILSIIAILTSEGKLLLEVSSI